MKISNVHVDANMGELLGAGWTDAAGLRYHVWFDPKTMTVRHEHGKDHGIIFKNPPTGTKHNGPGYFNTRRLKINNSVNRAIVQRVLDEVRDRDLIAAFHAHAVEKENERRKLAYAGYVENMAQEAGPDLLAALKAVLTAYNLEYCKPGSPAQAAALDLATKAIEKAKPEPIELLS